MSLATLAVPSNIIEDLASEVLRARAKFPHNASLNIALMEEVGELAAAQLQDLGPSAIRKEAIQVMALAVRIITESDASIVHTDESRQK